MIDKKMNAYPNPCDTCEEEPTCQKQYGCAKWLIRYRYRQKQINAYGKIKREEFFSARFVYQHPEEVRRYLRERPCGKCEKEAECDIPCTQYLNWYDARMQALKIKINKAKE